MRGHTKPCTNVLLASDKTKTSGLKNQSPMNNQQHTGESRFNTIDGDMYRPNCNLFTMLLYMMCQMCREQTLIQLCAKLSSALSRRLP